MGMQNLFRTLCTKNNSNWLIFDSVIQKIQRGHFGDTMYRNANVAATDTSVKQSTSEVSADQRAMGRWPVKAAERRQ